MTARPHISTNFGGWETRNQVCNYKHHNNLIVSLYMQIIEKEQFES